MKLFKRRDFLKFFSVSISIAGVLSIFPPTFFNGCSRKGEFPPNIVLILTDDQGFGDIGVNGNDEIKTPNIDQLASESIELMQFFVVLCAHPLAPV